MNSRLTRRPTSTTRRAGLGLSAAALLIMGLTMTALAIDGPPVSTLLASSFAKERKGQTGKALADVRKALRADSDNYVANLRAGWLSYRKARYADAVTYYRKCARLAPRALEPKLGAMLPLMALERWTEAARLAKQILAEAPRDYLGRSRLAWIRFSQGRYSAAERLYAAVLADYPSDADMMLGLAWTYARQGRRSTARAMFARVLNLRAGNESAKKGLAFVK